MKKHLELKHKMMLREGTDIEIYHTNKGVNYSHTKTFFPKTRESRGEEKSQDQVQPSTSGYGQFGYTNALWEPDLLQTAMCESGLEILSTQDCEEYFRNQGMENTLTDSPQRL